MVLHAEVQVDWAVELIETALARGIGEVEPRRDAAQDVDRPRRRSRRAHAVPQGAVVVVPRRQRRRQEAGVHAVRRRIRRVPHALRRGGRARLRGAGVHDAMMPYSLTDKVVLITGAARGQGAAEAELLSAARRHGHRLRRARRRWLGRHGWIRHVSPPRRHRRRRVGAGGRRGHRRARPDRRAGEQCGRLPQGAAGDWSADEIRNILDVNLVGPILGMQAVAPVMPSGSAIVNVASTAALRGFAGGASVFVVEVGSAWREPLGRAGTRAAGHPRQLRLPWRRRHSDDRRRRHSTSRTCRCRGPRTSWRSPTWWRSWPATPAVTAPGAEFVVDGGSMA